MKCLLTCIPHTYPINSREKSSREIQAGTWKVKVGFGITIENDGTAAFDLLSLAVGVAVGFGCWVVAAGVGVGDNVRLGGITGGVA